jgi:hypothetical protein
MVELLQQLKTDSIDQYNSYHDETGGKIQITIQDKKLIICSEDCRKYLKYYYLDELIYKQEIETLLQKRKKIEILFTLFNKELENNISYIIIDKMQAIAIFSKIIHYIIDIPYKNISLEFTPDSSIFFNILLNDKLKTHVEFYLTEENENYNYAFFNLFIQKESILNGYGKLIDIVQELNRNI